MLAKKEQTYLSRLSEIFLGSTDYKQMLRDSLKLVLEIFSCDRAWLLYPASINVSEFTVPIMMCKKEWYVPEGLTLPMDDFSKNLIRRIQKNHSPVSYYKTKKPFLPEYTVENHHVQSLLVTLIDPKIEEKWIFGIHQCTHEREWLGSEIDFFKRISDRMRDGLRNMLILQKMKESEQKYRTMFNSSRDAIILLDPQKGYLDCNPAALEIFAVSSKEEFTALNPVELSPKYQPNGSSSADLAIKEIDKALKEGANLFDWVHKDLNGREFPATVLATPIELEGKTILQGTIRDVTERKRGEKELEKTKALLTAAMAQSPAGIIIAEAPTGKIIFANRAAFGIRGQTNALLTSIEISDHSKNWKTFQLDGETPFLPEKLPLSRAILEGVTSENVELIIRSEKGIDRIVSANASPIKDKEGKIMSAIVIFHDITQRKQIEKELRKAQNYISNIINSMPSTLIGVDSEGKVTQWNNEAQRTTGLSMKEALGRPLPEVIPRLKDEMEYVYNAMETKKVYSDSRPVVINERETRYEDVTIYPLVANGVLGAVIRIDDVTKDFQLQEQLNQSQKMDAIGQLAGGVAHDFNNMLGGIIGAAELLQSPEIDLNQIGLNYVNMILEASNRAADLTAKLLAFGRKGKVSSTSIDVHYIIDDTLTLLKRTLDKKIEITVLKKAKNSIIVGDNSALQNSFLNLGINASQAMTDGGELNIKTSNIHLNENYCMNSSFDIAAGNYVDIEIRDSGCGIPNENIDKIFEPFFTTKKHGEGTGLGLASVYGTVQNHLGAITLESELGKGTVFHIYLPCSDSEIKESSTDKQIFKGTGKILLVDDEEIIRITGKFILEQMGYTVIMAEDGIEAVEIFKKMHSEIDLVIIDMIMPRMNGSEAFLKMREIDANCKVVISSGFTKNENLIELKEIGLSGFIQKPFRGYDLSKFLTDFFE